MLFWTWRRVDSSVDANVSEKHTDSVFSIIFFFNIISLTMLRSLQLRFSEYNYAFLLTYAYYMCYPFYPSLLNLTKISVVAPHL
jgi:hypothetical protein